MRLMKFALLVWNVVQRANTRAAGVVVVKFPLRNRAVIPDAAADLDHSRRAEVGPGEFLLARPDQLYRSARRSGQPRDRKSTRLNSSHITISYAVFCLKKKRNSRT